MTRIVAILVVSLLAGNLHAGDDPKTSPDAFRTEYPLKTPRPRDPVLGGSRDKVYFSVWIPPGVKDIRASEGTLFDHTVLLFGGAQISSHSGGSFPTILAGGGRLGFRHGQHVRFPGGRKPMSDLYLTILQQLGCPVRSFKESAGPIAEVLA